jgi:ABC-type sugar transport system substrate-binding protein
MSSKGFRTLIATAAVVSVLTAAACSSSNGQSSSNSSTSSTSSSAAVSTSSSATASGSAAAATSSGVSPIAAERVAAFTAHSQPLAETTPVTIKKPLTIAYMQCVQTVCEQIGQGLQEAAAAIGAKFLRFTHQDTPETVQQAAVDALQANPSMILFSGDPTQWFAAQLKEMNERHIPTIAWSEPGGFTPPGISANLLNSDDYYFLGVLEADWVAAKYGAGSQTLLLNVPAYPVLQTAGEGYVNELKTVCPSCSETTLNFTVDDVVSGSVATGVVAALQKQPKTKEIVGTFGGLITQQLAQAVHNAGFNSVKAISASGTSSNYQLIQQGDLQEADIALPSGFLAWRAIDVGLRLIAGQSVSASNSRPTLADIPGHPDIYAGGVPQEYVTKAQMPSGAITSVNQLWSPSLDYQAQFEKLWGVG